MMADRKSTLLSLPREIRDLIYGFLTQEAEFTWLWDSEKLRTQAINYRATVQVQLPILTFLSVYSRFRDEYLEAECFKRLKARAELHHLATEAVSTLQEEAMARRLREERLSRISEVTVFNHTRASNAFQLPSLFVQALAALAPKLSVIRLALSVVHIDNMSDSMVEHEYYSDAEVSHPNALGMLPADLIGLPLVQCGEGYRITYSHWQFKSLVRKSEKNLRHVSYRNGVYLYTRKNTNIPYWEVDEVIARRRLVSYLQDLVDGMQKEEAEETARLRLEMKEWKEKRGDEIEGW
jgi:hypothetical protein